MQLAPTMDKSHVRQERRGRREGCSGQCGGVFAGVHGRPHRGGPDESAGEYPLLAVSVREDGTVLVDGGRQVEHTYRVTVSAASDRERDGNTALLSSLTPVLLRGVPMGERTLHPLELKTEGETLTFTVELCVPLPQPEKPGMEPPGRMATLNLDI